MEDHDQQGHENDKLFKIRHSLAHVLAQAVLQVRPKAKLAFGPAIDTGFYYDFDLGEPLSQEDLPDIEKRMRRIIAERQAFEQFTRPGNEAVSNLQGRGEVYKAEYVQELIQKGEANIGFYRNGSFEDMCRGPHVAHTGEIPPDCFALDSIAGAYWRGDEKRPQLTRIYGLAFENKQQLADFQERRRLAKERDHRKLGIELELFTVRDEVGPGLILWLPNGSVLRETLEEFAKETEFRVGYQRVNTPHITKAGLYYTSGHLPLYQASMFPPMTYDGENAYYLKPMNCPHHHLIFKNRPRSYRELPLRLAEYGQCYRHEDSGSLSGLLRVRAMAMNDAHIYCTPEQVKSEFRAVMDLHAFYYKKFRITDYGVRFSLHDPAKKDKYFDDPVAWEKNERIVQEVLEEVGIRYVSGVGEGAFYGPKVDYQVKNVVGREETLSTVQLDFAVPPRFGLTYIGEDGKEHTPYCIHRAPLSTHERFLAFLIEHFGGAFPSWMAPTQVMIVPVADKFYDYARKLQTQLHEDLVRVSIDETSESFNKKIRNAVTHKIPNILVVGGKEEEQEAVTWRRYCVKDQRSMKFAEYRALLKRMVAERTMDNFADEPIPEA